MRCRRRVTLVVKHLSLLSRFSAVVVDGVVKSLNVEPDGTGYTVSTPEKALTQVRSITATVP